jgi:hypothetical protein
LDPPNELIKGGRGQLILDDGLVEAGLTCVTMPVWKVAE